MLYICNVDEKSILKGNKFSDAVKEKAATENNDIVIVSAAIESQIAEFESLEEKLELLKDLGLTKTTLKKVIYYYHK